MFPPDYNIAKYNLLTQEDCDTYYIEYHLSSDAAPAVEQYAKDEEFRLEYLRNIPVSDKSEHMNFRTFNYSKWVALRLGRKYSTDAVLSVDGELLF